MSSEVIQLEEQEPAKVVSSERNEKIRFKYDFVSGLFKRNLKIPEYQRPYRWKSKHVIQLLDDIHRNLKKEPVYRIGTIILHDNTEEYDIVDGQQRTVTVSLILHYLYSNVTGLKVKDLDMDYNLPILSNAFPHSDSQNNIRVNYDAIDEWFNKIPLSDRQLFCDFILNKCQVVVFIINDLSTAFQLFDSQNARGKALEPYDLLKAFHLREMQEETLDVKKECVASWEDAVNAGMLDNLGKYIFRIRKWARGERADRFSKNNIEEFKGVNVKEANEYPYMRSFMISDLFLRVSSEKSLDGSMKSQADFPFQITQPVINGRVFFKMVEHYNTRYRKIFRSEGRVRVFCNEYCLYKGHHRVGDTYVRELFEAILLFCDDKYGEKSLDEAQKIFYRWAYKLRLKQPRVFYSSIDKYVQEDNMFKKLGVSYHIKQIKSHVAFDKKAVKFPIDKVKKLFTLQ